MKLKDRIKTYNFWVSLSSALFLILKVLGNQFGFNVNENFFSDIVTSLCGILVILGIIVPPTNKSNTQTKQSNINNETLEPIISNVTEDLDTTIHEINLESSLNDTQSENLNQTFLNDAPCDVELNDIKEDDFDVCETHEDVKNEVNTQDLTIVSTQMSEMENNEFQNNDNQISDIKLDQQVADILAAQEKKFEGNSAAYIKLLQNQINSLQEK